MDLSAFTDPQLMALYVHGRQDAFDALFHRHHGRVYRMAYRMTGHASDAEELVQEVFLRVARAAPRYTPSAQFTTWLYRVTCNCCLTHCARRAPDNIVPLSSALAAPLPSPAPSPHDALRARQLAASLDRAIAQLPLPWRAAFALCVLEGLPGLEAAEILQLPLGTVKTHVHRARDALRRALPRDHLGARDEA